MRLYPRGITPELARAGCAVVLLAPLLALGCGNVSEIGDGTGGAGGDGGFVGGSGGTANAGDGSGGSPCPNCAGSSSSGGAVGGLGGHSGFGGSAGLGGSSTGGTGYGGATLVDQGYYVSEFLLGDTYPDGMASSNAWESYGTDLDGLTSAQASADHCRLLPTANAGVKRDGINGVDNSFGANILPILLGIAPDTPEVLNARAAAGESLVVVMGPSYDIVSGGSIARARTLPESDKWWVFDLDYPGGNANCELFGQVVNGKLSLIGGGYWQLSLPIGGFDLTIPIRQARVSGDVQVYPGVDNGMLSGLILTEDLVDALRQVAGALDPALCSGATFDSIAQQLRAASDIRADGTNGDPSVECDAISFGMGVKLEQAHILGFVSEPEPAPSCL